jgi:hypothetical protein
VAGSCEHGTESSGSINAGYFLTRWVTVSLSRRTLLYGVSCEEDVSLCLLCAKSDQL